MEAIDATDRNLNEIAFEGTIRVVTGDWQRFQFRDKVLMDPTWGDLLAAANRQLNVTKDTHHVFLENAYVIGSEKYSLTRQVELCLGS